MRTDLSIDRPHHETLSFVQRRKVRGQVTGIVCGFRTVLLVEHRDEVFARLASDFAAMGIRVERASCKAEVFRCLARCSPDLMIANAHLPDEGGWLLTAKLRLSRPTTCVWLYAPRPQSPEYDYGLAEFLGVAELIHYQGDLFLLGDELRHRLMQSPREGPYPNAAIPTDQSSAAGNENTDCGDSEMAQRRVPMGYVHF